MDPIYIPSRGRYKTISTHKHFDRCGMKEWYYVVEKFDYINYVHALEEQGIEDASFHVIPFDTSIFKEPYDAETNPLGFQYLDDLGWKPGLTTGPGPARNAIHQIAKERGLEHYYMMDDDIVGGAFRCCLEAHTDPAMPAVWAFERAGGQCVREGEELLGGVVGAGEAFGDQAVLMPKHVHEPAFAHEAVARLRPVDRIAEVLVIGAHRFRDGVARASRTEELPHGLLARPDLGEGAVQVVVLVDLSRLLRRTEHDPVRVLNDHHLRSGSKVSVQR